MKKIIKLTALLLPSLIIVYFLLGLPIKNMCKNGDFSWLPIPNCVLSLGDELKKQGFPSIVTDSDIAPDCDKIKHGWCVKEYGEIIQIGNLSYQMATITPKGFKMQF